MERRRARQPPTRPLVLLADGHDDTRELYDIALQSLGFETATVGGSADAYALAWLMHPDIIVTEGLLDVWDFLRDIKADPRTRDIPAVIVTSDSRAAARERATREGCAAFLVKPCLPDQLAAELRTILGTPVPLPGVAAR